MTRILYLTPLAPIPTTDGGRQRTNLLYQALARLGEVRTVVVNQTRHPITKEERDRLESEFGLFDIVEDRPAGGATSNSKLNKLTEQFIHLTRGWGVAYAADPAIKSRLAGEMNQADVVVSRYLWSASKAGAIGGPKPVIIDVDDRESERVRSAMLGRVDLPSWSSLKRAWWDRRINQLAAEERRLLARSSHFWLTKQQDLEGIDARDHWSLLPNIPFDTLDQPAQDPPQTDTPTILFVGSMAFPPNLNGVQRFLNGSWPTIHERHPNAKLLIVGKSAPEAWRAIPGVEVAGFVESLEDVYQQSAFSVVPLWEGAGTKIKVLESLQRCRAVVASPYAMRGYETHLIDQQSVRLGDDDAGLAQACIQLLEDPALAGRLAKQGQEQVHQHYTRAAFNRQVEATVTSLLSSAG